MTLTASRKSQHQMRDQSQTIPQLVYGTAWKKDLTKNLVELALNAGFVGIDTAAQPKHYDEKLAGDGIKAVLANGKIKREDLYVSLSLGTLWKISVSKSMVDQLHKDPNQIHQGRSTRPT